VFCSHTKNKNKTKTKTNKNTPTTQTSWSFAIAAIYWFKVVTPEQGYTPGGLLFSGMQVILEAGRAGETGYVM
jgi:hypothetical protein